MKRGTLKRKPFKSTPRLKHTFKETKSDEWNRIKREIRPYFEKYGLYDICELKLDGCIGNAITLQFAHAKKRNDIAVEEPYRTQELKQVVRSCTVCHNKIEYLEPQGDLTGRQLMYRIVTNCIEERNKRLKINSIYT